MASMVAAVVLNWNGEAMTRRCLASLASEGVTPLVVDNGSADGSGARLADAAEVLALAENRGFAGGMNAGCARAFERGASHVLLLNNDAVLAPGCVARLLAAGAALAAPTIVHGEPPAEGPLWYAGGRIGWHGEPRHDTAPVAGAPRPVGFASGCCLLVSRAAWQALGGLDERYFLYHEDVDLSLRAAALGLGLVHVPEARAWHAGGASTGSTHAKAPALDYYDARNGLLLIRARFTGGRRLAAWAWWALVRMPRKALRIALFAPDRRASWAAMAAGMRDGLAGRAGMGEWENR